MALDTFTVTGGLRGPDGTTPMPGTLRVWASAGEVTDDAGNKLLVGNRTYTSNTDGDFLDADSQPLIVLPKPGQAGLSPESFYYHAQFTSTDHSVRLKFDIPGDADVTFDELGEPIDAPLTPSIYTQTLAAKDEAVTSAGAAATSATSAATSATEAAGSATEAAASADAAAASVTEAGTIAATTAEETATTAATAVLASKQDVASLDADMAAKIGTDGTATKGALSDAIASGVAPISASPTYFNGAILTLIDDDGDALVEDFWQPIIAAKNFEMGFAIIGNRVGTAGNLSLAQIEALRDAGHDIYVHGWQSLASYDPANTPEMLRADWEQGQQYLRDNGFDAQADILVYPGGLSATAVDKKAVARSLFRYAITTEFAYNSAPLDNWAVQRINADTLTEAQIKAQVDLAVANNGWLVLMNHALEKQGDPAGQTTKIENVIDYARTAGVEVMKFSDAEKLKGNAVAVGEFTEAGSTFVSRMGKQKWNGAQGKWTPTLFGSSVAGAHTYTQQKGYYQVAGGMAVAKCSISIAANTPAVLTGTSDAVTIVTGGNFALTINGTTYGVALVGGDTPASVVSKINAAWGPGTVASLAANRLKITSVGTGPSSTYVVAASQGTILANLGLTVGQSAAGAGPLDTSMAGNLRVGGLPFAASALDVAAIAAVKYNNFNLGTNYTTLWASASGTFCHLLADGNTVAEKFLPVTALVAGQIVNIQFTMTYMLSDPIWA